MCVIGVLELSRYIIVWLLNNSCLICVTILVIYVFLNPDCLRSLVIALTSTIEKGCILNLS